MCLAEFSGYLLWLLLQILLNNRLEWKLFFFLSYLSKMKSCHYSRLIIPPRKTLHIGLLSHWRLWSVSSYLSNKKLFQSFLPSTLRDMKFGFASWIDYDNYVRHTQKKNLEKTNSFKHYLPHTVINRLYLFFISFDPVVTKALN